MFDNMKRSNGDLNELQAIRARLEEKIASNAQLHRNYQSPLWNWFANVFLKEEFRSLSASFITIPRDDTENLDKLRGKIEYVLALPSRAKGVECENEKLMSELSRTVRRIQELQRKQKET